MRNSVKLLFVAVLCIVSVQSCDFVRSAFNMPTSADLEQIRLQRAAEARSAREKALKDSLAAVQAALDSIAAQEEAAKADTIKAYYIVVGAFSSLENARKLCSRLEQKGYEAGCFKFKKGLNVVTVSGGDDFDQVTRECVAVAAKEKDLQPWVYRTAEGRHSEKLF